MYAFLSLYPDVFTTHLLFTHIKGINWQDSCNTFFKMGSNDSYGIMIELNIS